MSGSRLNTGQTLVVAVAGRAGIHAAAVMVNLTPVGGTAPSFLTAWPTGEAQPVASSVNWHDASPQPDLATVLLGSGGSISLYNAACEVDLWGWVCFDRWMSTPVRVRRLTDHEGRLLQQIVRRGGGRSEKSIVKWRRAMVVMASASGNTVPAIAKLVLTSEDRVREMIHRFNELGVASLDPQWAGGRPRQITIDDEAFIVATATKRPEVLGQPFTRWSLRKLARFLGDNPQRIVTVGHERLRQILDAHEVTFQRTKTWKESNDPDRDVKLDRIEEVTKRWRAHSVLAA